MSNTLNSEYEDTSKLDKIHQKITKFFPTVNLFKDITNDDIISKEEIQLCFIIFGILVTSIVCMVPLWQLIQISIRTKSLMIVEPIIPKEDNPYGKFLIASLQSDHKQSQKNRFSVSKHAPFKSPKKYSCF